MEKVHEWECPRCGAIPEDPVRCRCGLTRKGWLTDSTEYEYGSGDTVVRVSSNTTEVLRLVLCAECERTDCPAETDEEVVETLVGQRFDLLALMD